MLHLDGDTTTSSSSSSPTPPPPHSLPPLPMAASSSSTITAQQQLLPLPKQDPRTNSKTLSRNSSSVHPQHVIDVCSDFDKETENLGPTFSNHPQLSGSSSSSSDGPGLWRNPSIRQRILSRRPSSDKQEDEHMSDPVAAGNVVVGGECTKIIVEMNNSGVDELRLEVGSQIVKEEEEGFKSLREPQGGVKEVALASGSHLEHGVAVNSKMSNLDTLGFAKVAKRNRRSRIVSLKLKP